MADVWANLGNGIYRKVKKAFYRPFSVFDIGWTKEKFLKHQTSNSLQSHLYKNKYKVTFENGPSFLISIKELFINELYKFRSDKDNPVIIDCGSYIGTSILYFKDNYPNAVVLGFEPDQKNYQILKTNLENWNFSNVQVQNAAIWINNGNIFFNSRGDMSSQVGTDADSGNSETVKSVRLNDLLDKEVDFLKIDIEGAELPVLQDCADNLKNVKNLFIEYHGKYEESYKLNGILDILIKNNFKYCIKEGDAIYARPFWDRDKLGEYDMYLNIFAFRD